MVSQVRGLIRHRSSVSEQRRAQLTAPLRPRQFLRPTTGRHIGPSAGPGLEQRQPLPAGRPAASAAAPASPASPRRPPRAHPHLDARRSSDTASDVTARRSSRVGVTPRSRTNQLGVLGQPAQRWPHGRMLLRQERVVQRALGEHPQTPWQAAVRLEHLSGSRQRASAGRAAGSISASRNGANNGARRHTAVTVPFQPMRARSGSRYVGRDTCRSAPHRSGCPSGSAVAAPAVSRRCRRALAARTCHPPEHLVQLLAARRRRPGSGGAG